MRETCSTTIIAAHYAQEFTPATLANAWWEVVWFLAMFLALTPITYRLVNRRQRHQGSQVFQMLRAGANQTSFQLHLNQLFWGCAIVWLALAVIACIRLGSDESPYYFFPFLGHKANPWGRGRIGGGYDALLSLASYFQMFVAAAFGIVAALARNPRVRFLALAGCLLIWPYYILDRTRNSMLAVVVPAILAWVFLRLRGGVLQKAVVLLVFFLMINAWFGFVMANRSNTSIASALHQKGFDLEQNEDVHHEGLNMYEELCWINKFIKDGTFNPPWGREYFAEVVNPIPRTLWAGKPIDWLGLRRCARIVLGPGGCGRGGHPLDGDNRTGGNQFRPDSWAGLCGAVDEPVGGRVGDALIWRARKWGAFHCMRWG